jgi:hypothetical protein
LTSKTSPLELTLVLPGLLRFEKKAYRELFAQAESLPALELIISRSQRLQSKAHDFESVLGDLFDLPAVVSSSLPAAALARYLKFGEFNDCWYMHCDPVAIQPNRDHLMMLGNDLLDISEQEAEQIISEINATYHDQPWQLLMLSPKQWVLELKSTPKINTHTLKTVLGKKINEYLPTGEDAKTWHALLNELQMLLHTHPVNRTREANGLPTINSVWFWGEGKLPGNIDISASEKNKWAQCWSNHTTTLALAKLADIPRVDCPLNANNWFEHAITPGHHLVVTDKLDITDITMDPFDWWQALSDMNEQWFAPLLSALKSNSLNKLTLLSGEGRSYVLTPALAKRWWKRIKPLV